MEEKVALTLKGVPKGLRKSFKTMCAEKEISMQDRIMQLMAQDIADHDAGRNL